MHMKKIIFATGNQHKLEEIRAILPGFDIISAKEAGVSLDIEETGTTFKENAYIKAKAIWDITGGIHKINLLDFLQERHLEIMKD